MVGKSHIGKSHTRQIPTQPYFWQHYHERILLDSYMVHQRFFSNTCLLFFMNSKKIVVWWSSLRKSFYNKENIWIVYLNPDRICNFSHSPSIDSYLVRTLIYVSNGFIEWVMIKCLFKSFSKENLALQIWQLFCGHKASTSLLWTEENLWAWQCSCIGCGLWSNKKGEGQ